MLRLIISASLFTIASMSGAHATNFDCNPAVQNWVNGSKTTCPFDSNSGVAPAVQVTTVLTYTPPVETDEPSSDDNLRDE